MEKGKALRAGGKGRKMGKEREKKKRNRSLSARRSTYNNVSAFFFCSLFRFLYSEGGRRKAQHDSRARKEMKRERDEPETGRTAVCAVLAHLLYSDNWDSICAILLQHRR